MIWVRSWPETIPPLRPYVVDQLRHLIIQNGDLATGWNQLQGLWQDREPGEHGVILVEWDVAYGEREAQVMNGHALNFPDRVAVAPYRKNGVWIHSDGALPGESWIQELQAHCDHFALGLTYLPWTLLQEFVTARQDLFDRRLTDWRMTDTNLSLFHYRTRGPGRVDVLWDARPVHLGW